MTEQSKIEWTDHNFDPWEGCQKDVHTQDAVKRINEAKERGADFVNLAGLEIKEIPKKLLELAQILCDLYLSDTDISDVSPLANLTKLASLYLGSTKVSDISSLANLTNLERLSLWRTGVSDISSLANLKYLKELDLHYTKVSDVSPLAHLTNLEWLFLSDANVSDISPLANLTKLASLILRGTNVSDISPLAHLPKLGWLDISSCPLVKSAANIQTLEKLRENGCKIYGAQELMK